MKKPFITFNKCVGVWFFIPTMALYLFEYENGFGLDFYFLCYTFTIEF